jgi:hypothetical protein
MQCSANRVKLNTNPLIGDSDEADRHSDLIAITVPGWIRSVVGAKRRWRMDFPESDHDRRAYSSAKLDANIPNTKRPFAFLFFCT